MTSPKSATKKRPLAVLGPFIGLVFIVTLFGFLAPDTFLTTTNFKTVATQTVMVALGAIGMTFVIISGGIDLSVGSVIALSSVATALMLDAGLAPSLAAILGAGVGTLCGIVNGMLVTSLRIVPFIATLGMMGMARGLAKYLAGEQKVDAQSAWLPDLLTINPHPSWLLVSPGVWITLGLAALMAFILHRTTFGTHTKALGSNESTARLCGIRVALTKIKIYALAGTFTGLAGVVSFTRLSSGDPTAAPGKELDVIAAVVIGGGSLAGGEGSILGSLIGAFIMQLLHVGCQHSGVPESVRDTIIGAIIVIAVALDRVRHTRRR